MHTILMAPTFEDRRPGLDSTIWRVSLSVTMAFKLICDIGHLYPSPSMRPRIGAMLENDGAWTLYAWPRVDPDSRLLMLMLDYGAARQADCSRWVGQAWLSGDLLAIILAKLATRAYWAASPDPRLLADERAGWLLSLPKAVTP